MNYSQQRDAILKQNKQYTLFNIAIFFGILILSLFVICSLFIFNFLQLTSFSILMAIFFFLVGLSKGLLIYNYLSNYFDNKTYQKLCFLNENIKSESMNKFT